MYIHHNNIFIPVGSGHSGWYQILGSPIFSSPGGKLMIKKFATGMHEF